MLRNEIFGQCRTADQEQKSFSAEMSPAGAGSDDRRRRPQFDCFSSFLFSFSFFCQSPIFGYDGKPFVRLWIRIWKGEENCQSVLACTHVILRSVGGGRGEIEILKEKKRCVGCFVRELEFNFVSCFLQVVVSQIFLLVQISPPLWVRERLLMSRSKIGRKRKGKILQNRRGDRAGNTEKIKKCWLLFLCPSLPRGGFRKCQSIFLCLCTNRICVFECRGGGEGGKGGRGEEETGMCFSSLWETANCGLASLPHSFFVRAKNKLRFFVRAY